MLNFRLRPTNENILLRYLAISFPKYSPLTEAVNEILAQMRAGGLLVHYNNDPTYLEQTLPLDVFTFHDDSKDILTMEPFMLIFVMWGFGMISAIVGLILENVVHQLKRSNQLRHQTNLRMY